MIALLLAQTIAITGGTVYPVSGPKLANASVLIRDGRIVAVGTNVPIPPDATRIDAAGKWITPGLIDGAGQIGLVEISAVPGTRDASVQGDTIAASFNVAEGINPASTVIPVANRRDHDRARRADRQPRERPGGPDRSRRRHDRADAREIAGGRGRRSLGECKRRRRGLAGRRGGTVARRVPRRARVRAA